MSLQDVMDLGKEPASLPALLNEERFQTPETDTTGAYPAMYPKSISWFV